jgi:hypothetical protein
MDSKSPADRHVAGVNKWMVGLTLGLWALVFIMSAVRFVNTGHTSVFLVLVGVSCLLSLAGSVVRHRGARWLLRSGGAAAIAVAAYMFFRGVR